MLSSVKKGIAKVVPESSRRSKREPVTLEYMHCLLLGLDLTNAKDAAIYAAASIAFHGISADLCDYLSNPYLVSFLLMHQQILRTMRPFSQFMR
jgi:hypothetical protein